MRLDKLISQTTSLSRQEARRVVHAGRVLCNGHPVRKSDTQLAEGDVVTLDGEVLCLRGPRYFMLHKPAGYICANTDSHHPVVLDLLDEDVRDLQIAGRLDIDTTGLVLITDDGQWNHRITSPARACQKVYRVTLAEDVTDSARACLEKGVLLQGEEKPTRPATLTFLQADDRRNLRIAISEGKYHQVKRMFAATGNAVVTLHRESIGAIVLDTTLQPGEYRALHAEEIASI